MRARRNSRGALGVVVLITLVLGLMPSFGAYAEQGSDSAQLPTGTYWYNGDVSFSTIDKNNGFTAEE